MVNNIGNDLAEFANALRFLSVDMIENAGSGHPGMPLGMADIAAVLWGSFLRHNPNNPGWLNRDRFVLSNGHGCALLYALLHLTGYPLSIEDLQQLRRLDSKTPGHPELGLTPGVDMSTGPLGQGLAAAVGLAIAEQHLAAVFNRDNFAVIDHYTYVFAGDGCLMEGISHEACSLAGVLKLGKLIVFYDDNNISIDGQISAWCQDDVALRFAAYGWHVISQVAGHDHAAITAAIRAAQAVSTQPTLICCQTTIGYGAPTKAGQAGVHGSVLGAAEVAAMRAKLLWPHAPWLLPGAVYQQCDRRQQGQDLESRWQELWDNYRSAHPELAAQLERRSAGRLPADWSQACANILNTLATNTAAMATRHASKLCLNHYAPMLPELFGGSADLTESTGACWSSALSFTASQPAGCYLHYGVREFAMSAIMNGLAAHKGIIPYGGTFLVFSDYARNAVRMAALMQVKVIFVYTHDSIGVGEDGPSHQPVEHLASLRMIPNLAVWRPCDLSETAVAWQLAIERAGPSCLILSRQNLPAQERTAAQLTQISRGGYVLCDYSAGGQPMALIIATGSEVHLAVQAAQQLAAEHIYVRVVSMPSLATFLAQDPQYQAQILPPDLTPRVIVEAAASHSWYQLLVGARGLVLGVNQFGHSAAAAQLYEVFGLTSAAVAVAVKELLTTC